MATVDLIKFVERSREAYINKNWVTDIQGYFRRTGSVMYVWISYNASCPQWIEGMECSSRNDFQCCGLKPCLTQQYEYFALDQVVY